ncbi:AMP-binding protein [Paenibacillus mucilaginosus]|uniref:Acyl-CoA synthetase n=1 Tax=Paenibacillus mucilaginosus (strain KNP414) TaxID=1036673 RepID=F8FKH3_PAEMK|nr:AMP-binding protein [Paenibacillus mucilaginosus]AEI45566.1 hypothetical protein KNP414_07054 [Paenibacillus mucilaginosus KNP414]MCG7215314.1 AMP-binding protein [Paenibacillus mucilaginosus]WDM31444.1 AMP-binding protein [Paenibacillus mucilaginosus]
MFTVNRERFSATDARVRLDAYGALEHFRSPEGRLYALCLSSPADVVTLVLFLRERGGSVLLLAADTPLETALASARQAGAYALVFGTPEQCQVLPGTPAAQEEPSLYSFSSGTTGGAKLIRRSWSAVAEEIAAYNEAIPADAGETPVVLASVTHSYGLLCGVLATLERGVSPVIVTNKNPKFALSVIRDTPKHLVYGVPTLFHMLTGFSQEGLRFHKLMTSGAPMPAPLFERLSGLADTLLQQYGCSEAGCISISPRMEAATDMGLPLRHWKLELDSREEAQPSELAVTGRAGRIATGDLGYIAPSGHIHLLSRIDDVINVSGLKVFPLEVEEVLLGIPGVAEAVVYRGRHPVMGEIVKTRIVASGRVSADDVRDVCLQRLPAYKVPADIEFVTAIPKNPTGKISRKRLEMEDATR